MKSYSSQARNINLAHMGGEVFTMAEDPSDQAVLWAELFGGKERKFLRELLTSEEVCFTLQDTYQISVRTLFHSQAQRSVKPGSGMRRDGKFILMLHALEGDLTSSWTWAKFIRPMYRNGLSVVLVDLPGMGKSTVSRTAYCPVSRWREYDHHIISKILEELGIARCHICAVGTGCGILMRMLQRAQHRLEAEHFMLSPELDRDELFAHVGIDPEPGAPAGWEERIREKQQKALIDLMRTSGTKIWTAFDRGVSYGADDGEMNEKRFGHWKRQYDTYQLLTTASLNEFVGQNTVITEVMRADICDAQLGQNIKVRALIPSRNLKNSLAKYFSKQNNAQWATNFIPHHKKQTNTTFRAARIISRSVAAGMEFEDSESDEEKGASRQSAVPLALEYGSPSKSKLAHEKALALMNSGSEDGPGLQLDCLTMGGEMDRAEVQRAKQALEDRLDRTASSSSKLMSRTGRRSIVESASDSNLSMNSTKTKRESALFNGANVARELMTIRGARPATGQPGLPDPKSSEKGGVDWNAAPFERDLSYGVRNMFMQAFEASVQTFKQEEEARIENEKKFKFRTALRRGHTGAFKEGRKSSKEGRRPSKSNQR